MRPNKIKFAKRELAVCPVCTRDVPVEAANTINPYRHLMFHFSPKGDRVKCKGSFEKVYK